MADKRKQLNVRMDEETESLIAQLQPAVSTALGVTASIADLIRLALRELAAKYLKPAKKAK